jgi:hypothetical protein
MLFTTWKLRRIRRRADLHVLMRKPLAVNVYNLYRARKPDEQHTHKRQHTHPARMHRLDSSAFDSLSQGLKVR